MTTLSRREKVLAAIVGGTVALLLNGFLLSFFFQNQARLRTDLARREGELKTLRILLEERPVAEQRTAWLQGKQPRLENEQAAAFQLLDRIKAVAQTHVVKLERQEPGKAERRTQYTSVPVSIETRSDWKSLIRFMHELQGPEQFIVLESANLQVDKQDQTQMHGAFRIARWYAPK